MNHMVKDTYSRTSKIEQGIQHQDIKTNGTSAGSTDGHLVNTEIYVRASFY